MVTSFNKGGRKNNFIWEKMLYNEKKVSYNFQVRKIAKVLYMHSSHSIDSFNNKLF